ncbi:MAG: hypothetical protein WBB48_07775 [Thermodesulfobacteriota bacterium]
MDNIKINSVGESKSFFNFSFIEKHIIDIVSNKSSNNSDLKVGDGRNNKISKKYLPDEYLYFAYRI